MEEFIQSFFKMLNPKLSAVIGGVLFMLMLVPKLFRLWEEWKDFRYLRSERKDLELKKLRLEVKALMRQYGDLPSSNPIGSGPAYSEEPLTSGPQKESADTLSGDQPSSPAGASIRGRLRPWRWVTWLSNRRPLLARIVLVLLALVHLPIAIFFGVVFVEGILGIIDPVKFAEFTMGGPGGTIALTFSFAMLFLYAVWMIRKLNRQRRSIVSH